MYNAIIEITAETKKGRFINTVWGLTVYPECHPRLDEWLSWSDEGCIFSRYGRRRGLKLVFRYDHSVERGERISAILDELGFGDEDSDAGTS